MAINVTKFMVSNDLRSLELDITCDSGATITSIALWNEDTYNNPASDVIQDFTPYLDGTTNSESIILGQSALDPAPDPIPSPNPAVALLGTIFYGDLKGMYFMRISSSNGDAITVATVNLTQFYIVEAKLLANVDLSCLNCNTNFQNALLMDLYMEAVKSSLTIGRFKDAIQILKKLKITTETGDCDECLNIEPLISSAGNIVSVGVIDCTLQTT